MSTPGKSTVARWMVGLSLLWPVLVVLALLSLYPNYPKNQLHWTLLVVLGPPAILLAEGVGTMLFSEHLGHRISSKAFSWLRIAFGVAFIGALFAIGAATTWLISR